MTWNSFHRRGDVLRTVITTVDERRDGVLPMDVDGVAETFSDELNLLGAMLLRWHTRLAGHIEREQLDQPMDLERSVVTAWQRTADDMPGLLAVIDHYRAEPIDAEMAEAMRRSLVKERSLLAVMAGKAGAHDEAAAARVGAGIEARARSTHRPARGTSHRQANHGLFERLKAALAA